MADRQAEQQSLNTWCVCNRSINQGACQADRQLTDGMAAVQQAAEVQQVAKRLLCNQVKAQSAQEHLRARNQAI